MQLLKRVQSGEMSLPAALNGIADTKKLVENVRRLLRRLGDKDEQLALTKRYSRMMASRLIYPLMMTPARRAAN